MSTLGIKQHPRRIPTIEQKQVTRPVNVPFPRGTSPPRRRGSGIHFSSIELISILVSMITMALAFHMFGVSDTGLIVGVMIGITLHEISHKVVAQALGFESRYKLWEIGIVLILAFAIITRGKFIFAAPGFVVTEGIASVRERGIISLAAPFSNMVLAALFFLFGGTLWISAAYVNTLLAVFNLIPIEPLDGATVIKWNQSVWSLCFLSSLILGAVYIFM